MNTQPFLNSLHKSLPFCKTHLCEAASSILEIDIKCKKLSFLENDENVLHSMFYTNGWSVKISPNASIPLVVLDNFYKANCLLIFHPWEVCSLDDLWSFAASHSLKHFINRCTWKSSQYYIIISRMTSFIRMSQKLVFHQSKCICAIKRILSTTTMYVSSSSCICVLHVTAMHA